ncbi:hypothetical protein ACTFIW_003756 [Dictyostelium discoideum]
MKYKLQKIEFNTPTEDELLYTIKLDKETNKPIISLLHSTGTSIQYISVNKYKIFNEFNYFLTCPDENDGMSNPIQPPI